MNSNSRTRNRGQRVSTGPDMQIAIVSGKGGTGKTTLATRLFAVTEESTLLDCDTEEPNSGIFLDVAWNEIETVKTSYPEIDEDLCTHCGACAKFCAFGAILSAPTATIPMAERCHDCRGCAMVCPHDAITYQMRPMGKIGRGETKNGRFAFGELNIGEYSGVRIISLLRKNAADEDLVWIDGPPGTACSAVAAVQDADFAVLVGEPTPFGVSDMSMAVEMLRDLKVPFGIVVNKAGIGDDEIYDYCRKEHLEILGEVPFDRSMAEALAHGRKGWETLGAEPWKTIADSILAAAAYVPGSGNENVGETGSADDSSARMNA